MLTPQFNLFCQSCCCAIFINLFHKCDYSWTGFFSNVIFWARYCFVEQVDLPITSPPVIHQCHQSLKIEYDNKCLTLFSDDAS